MLVLRGAPALSAFRHDKLLQTLGSKLTSVKGVYAEFVHFADLSRDLNDSESSILDRILRYGPKASVKEPKGTLFLVVPRMGTISPWASKATDIARNCGLEAIKRLERGIAYYIETDSELTDDDRQQLADELHDRMVETVLADTESAAALFQREAPRELSRVDVLEGGREAMAVANGELGLALTDDEIDYLV